jgi:tetratricopeptide (TPR) repeat protein
MADAVPIPFSTANIAHLYPLPEIEGWRLLGQHFDLVEGFAFIVVTAPDEWGIVLAREHLPEYLPEPGAIERVCFDPAGDPDLLADVLLRMPAPGPQVRVVWIDAEPGPPESLTQRDEQWEAALAKLNRYRNPLQAKFRCTLALALPARVVPHLRKAAPDFWTIRSGVFRIEHAGSTRATFQGLPVEEWQFLDRAAANVSGDSAVTLAEAEKLRGKPGRELLLAELLLRAGRQARQKLDWKTAIRALEEAYSLQEQYGADPEMRMDVATELGQVFHDVARLDRAEFYSQRALEVAQHHFGPEHPQTAIALNNLAQLLQDTNRLAEAEPLMRRALEIAEQSYGAEHPSVAIRLNNLAQLLQATNRLAEAEPLMRRALEIAEQSYGAEHPRIAIRLNNLAALLKATNRLAEAEPLMRRALAIDEQSYGAEHPDVARDLNNLAQLLQATNRLAEAEPLMRRALEIDEQSYGAEHPNVAIRLSNLAALYYSTNRLEEAEPLMRRALEIFLDFTHRTGHEHQHLRVAIANYESLLKAMGKTKPEIQAALASLTHPT